MRFVKILTLLFVLISSSSFAHHNPYSLPGDDGDYYQIPQGSQPYIQDFIEVEDVLNIPDYLLVELAYSESRFRTDIIDCRIISSAGAKGIMQIIPSWHPGVDPCEPFQSIRYAGAYLKYLYKRYNSWYGALVAYGWGLGRYDAVLRGEMKVPKSVEDYADAILNRAGFTKVKRYNPPENNYLMVVMLVKNVDHKIVVEDYTPMVEYRTEKDCYNYVKVVKATPYYRVVEEDIRKNSPDSYFTFACVEVLEAIDGD